MKNCSAIRSILVLLCVAALPIAAFAQQYSARDAQYVTSSRNIDVLDYVVCLEDAFNHQPRRMSTQVALDNAVADCRYAAVRLPRSRTEPSAADLKQAILECGFSEGEASPDMDCSGAATAASPSEPDIVYADPTVIEVGRWLEGIAISEGVIWAAESGQRTTAEFDFNNHELLTRHKVGRLPVDVSVVGEEVFTLVVTDRKIVWHSPQDGDVSHSSFNQECPDAMVPGDTRLWVLTMPDCSSETSTVVSVEVSSGEQKTSANLGEWATDIIALDDEVWVSHARDDRMSVINKSSFRLQTISVPGAETWSLSTDFDFIYGGGRASGTRDDGLVVKIDPISQTEVARASVPGLVLKIGSEGTFVYAVNEIGIIYILSAADLTLLRTVEPATGSYRPTQIMFHEDLVIIAAQQYRDENGAIFLFANLQPDTPAQAVSTRRQTTQP